MVMPFETFNVWMPVKTGDPPFEVMVSVLVPDAVSVTTSALSLVDKNKAVLPYDIFYT